MNLLTLVNEESVLLASGKRVFNAVDTGALQSSVETANQLAQLLATREAEIEAARVAGREAGYQEGRAAGLDDARNTLGTQLIQLRERADELAEQQRTETVKIALLVVRKITEELAPEQTLVALANAAARGCIDDPTLVLKVHPDKADAVRHRLKVLATETEDRSVITQVLSDVSLDVNGCILESRLGAIVADLETQLHALESSLTPES